MSNYTISTAESRKINVCRAICIFLVLYIHSYNVNLLPSGNGVCLFVQNVLSQNICRGAVPLLFFISSILLYRKEFEWKENMKKKVKSLLVPYVVLNLLWIILFAICQNIPYLSKFFGNPQYNIMSWGIEDWLDGFIGYSGMPLLYPLWFVRDLFLLNVFSVIIKKVCDYCPMLIFVVCLLLFLFDANLPVYRIFLNPFQSLFFWVAGYLFVKRGFHLEKLTLSKQNVFVLVFIYVLLVIINNYPPLYIDLTTSTILHGIIILVGMVLIVNCSTMFARVLENLRFEKVVMTIAIYSFPIYLFHELWLSLVKKTLMMLFPDSISVCMLTYFVLPLLIMLFCIGLSRFLEINIPTMYSVLVGGRTSKKMKH